jgi:hypothetical protein
VTPQPQQQVAYSRGRKPTRAKQFGVTDDEYARLLAAQDGHCALCPATPKTRRLHSDHDHASKPPRVRGLLCHRCNRALPAWITVRWLVDAANYIDPDACVTADAGTYLSRAL